MDVPTLNWPEIQQQLDALIQTLPAPEEPPRGVVTQWPEMTFFLDDSSWEIFFRNFWYSAGGAVRESVLRRSAAAAGSPGEQRLAVKIYVSSQGPVEARDYFLQEALSPTIEPLYEIEKHGETLILRFAAPLPITDDANTPLNNDSLLLLYRNVVFDVRSYQSTLDVRLIGLRLQSFAAPFADHHLKAPGTPVPRLSPREQDAEIVVDLPTAPDPAGDFRATDFDIRVQTTGEVAFQGFVGATARFRRLGAEGSLHVEAVDRRTLLASELTVNLP